MKKTIFSLLALFISFSLFAQHTNDDKAKKDNMGQSISEVNSIYKDQIKAIKADPNLTKAERKQRRKELKEMKRNRIHEINSGGAKRQNDDRANERDKDNRQNENDKNKNDKGKDKDKIKGPKTKG